MKRARLSLIVLSAVLIFGVTFAAAESDNAALIIKLDEGCEWQFGGLTAAGRLHYVETQNGKWVLSCHGEIVEGLPIDQAVTVHSTADTPMGVCFTPFDSTPDFHATYSPSGAASFICQGDLTP